MFEVHGERMTKRTFTTGFRIKLHLKDLALAPEGARKMGISLPNTVNPAQLAPVMRCACMVEQRAFLCGLFEQAVGAVQPAQCVPRFMPAAPPGRTIVIGAGKAGAAMAAAFEAH